MIKLYYNAQIVVMHHIIKRDWYKFFSREQTLNWGLIENETSFSLSFLCSLFDTAILNTHYISLVFQVLDLVNSKTWSVNSIWMCFFLSSCKSRTLMPFVLKSPLLKQVFDSDTVLSRDSKSPQCAEGWWFIINTIEIVPQLICTRIYSQAWCWSNLWRIC